MRKVVAGVNETGPDGAILFFDGHCALCNGFVDFLIARDRNHRLRFAPIPGETSTRLLPDHPKPGETARNIVLWRQGVISRGSEAGLRALTELGGLWRMAGVLHAIPRPIRDGVYDLIARNRYRIFGYRIDCRMPTEAEKGLFLP